MGREGYKALILVLLVLASCKKDKPAPIVNTLSSGTGGVYVVCEGAYPQPNASLFLYKPSSDSVFGDLYQGANGQPLGEVFQSMAHIGDYLFLAVDASDKIAVVSADGFKHITDIPVYEPRYILPVGNDKAYVSTYRSNKVYIINTASFTVTGSITMPAQNPEGMCLLDNNAYICTWDTGSQNIYKVDVTTDQIVQTIKVAGAAPNAVVVDKDKLLWVLSGNQDYNKAAALTHIDPSTGDILGSFSFGLAANPVKTVFNNTKDTLYYIEQNYYGGTANNGIYRMGIHEGALPAIPFIGTDPDQYFYALGIDPHTGNIYISDPVGFTQKGKVLIYNTSATLLSTFKVGIAPGEFYFDE